MKRVPNLKPRELRKQQPGELREKVVQLRAELARLRSAAGRGILKKESGSIRVVRRNLARLQTVLNAQAHREET